MAEPKPKAAGKVAWEAAPTEFTQRTVFMQIDGETGSGRSTLAFSAPGPIALIHTMEKIPGIVEKFAREKEIKIIKLGMGNKIGGTRTDLAKNCIERIAIAKDAIWDASTWAKTIMIDTHTDLWEILRLARFGTLTPQGLVSTLYGPVNAEWNAIFDPFKDDPPCNLIAIGKVGEQYRNDKPTGVLEAKGQKDFIYKADVRIRTLKAAKKGESPTFKARIDKGWMNAQYEGMEFEGEEATFANIMAMITEVDASEWE